MVTGADMRTVISTHAAIGAASLLLLACGGEKRSASNDVVRLDSAGASYPGLEYVTSVQELADGRVVVPQPGGPLVLVLDLETGKADTLGRSGDGPGEYRRPTVAMIMHGNPAVLDPQQQRITSWHPDGTVDSMVTIPLLPSWTVAVDTLGNVYSEQPSTQGFIIVGQEVDTARSKDSTWIYRLHPPETGRDTVGRLYEIGWKVLTFKEGVARDRLRYASADQWGVLPDGSMWILRGQENRVDRRSADGTWTAGLPRPWQPIRTTDADRVRMNFPWAQGSDTMYFPMADEKGPYQDRAVAAPDGEVWVRLNTVAGDSTVSYETFPVSGASTGTVVLPYGRKVVAVSQRFVYAVHEDADGFQVLERFRRP